MTDFLNRVVYPSIALTLLLLGLYSVLETFFGT